MHLYRNLDRTREKAGRKEAASAVKVRESGAGKLRATAVVLLGLTTAMPPGLFAQQTSPQAGNKVFNELPAAPAPTDTEPLFLRSTSKNYLKPYEVITNPKKFYEGADVPNANFMNSLRLTDLVKNGKIYLSLSDALTLALENNYDLAIARYNLDIADTDILRAKSGSLLRGVNSGLVTNTLGGTSSTLTVGGGPGGTSAGAATGATGLVISTDGAGPLPPNYDPYITGTLQWERASAPQSNTLFSGGKTSLTTNTNQYNFGYNQGFRTGATLQATITNERITTDNPFVDYSPQLSSVFKATVTQPFLNGGGMWLNRRFIQEAIYDRRITDSAFRQQVLYTVNQVENIYWALVSSYEDLQAKERALEQSKKVAADDRKQLEIGTMAPLDVVTADSQVASDQQALVSSQSNLNYQQLIIKQAIARNLSDPALIAAPVIPTDRVSLEQLPEETESADELTQAAFKNRPELEQAALSLKKDQITLKATKNALLPTLNGYVFYGSSALGGSQSPNAENLFATTPGPYPPGTFPTVGYGQVLQNLFNSTAPDKGAGFTLSVPLRNRTAQADRARSLLEYRQQQLRLEQLYTEIKMQVVNQQFALTNDRAAVLAADASQKYNAQSLDAEEKKLHLGASTTALVLQQERNLATAENNLTAARAAYAKDRAALYQLLATTLQHYGINLIDAATGTVNTEPVIPGIEPAQPTKEPTLPNREQRQQQEQQIQRQGQQPEPKPQPQEPQPQQ
ncbi:TolC family protein [Acidicapsa dinghuensis]|uniref:TolC family protein n=1 Tax=Acidicapsa dinghuensis TaxID=2218256 RepID=A0ABW1ENV4_9BACT|nr:TolC family protein [Acidicapsa dinghuensis]